MSKKKKEINIPQIVEDIVQHSLDNLMGECYSVYAKDVVQGRSIPDVRDGLKPVQRRIIFDMDKNGYVFEKETVKCAKIVGDVIGKFHPHGDTSVYDALVRISQDWKLIAPLVKFQGNNGSIDGDGAAAYRYTEAKLTKLSQELIQDIDKKTVDMILNFDDTEYEPVVLPAKFPNLYVNGADGIAVGIATAIPTHNLAEMCNAVIYRLEHQDCELDELLNIVKGPDFPTGGIIFDGPGLRSMYETGKGRVEICSKWKTEHDKFGHHVIISEIPYEVPKKKLVYEIDKIAHSNAIDGIVEVRDETEMDALRIVIDIKENCDPDIILEYLKKNTSLLSAYNANMVAIVNGRPKLLSLIDYIDAFIDFQQEIYTKKAQFLLDTNSAKVHIYNGLIKAASIIDDVIATIKASKNKGDAKANLINKFEFTDPQAEAILMMQLYRLSNTDIVKLEDDIKSLNKEISHLKGLLTSKTKLNNEIINELKVIVEKFGNERKSIIGEKWEEVIVDKRDLIANEENMFSITRDGYIKRSNLLSYDRSKSVLPGLKTGDKIVSLGIVNTIDYALCFTNKGNYLFIPIHEITENKWKDEGKHINYISQLPLDEQIIKAIRVEEFNENAYICAVSKQGQIRKTKLSDFMATRYNRPISMMKLGINDEVSDVCLTDGNSNILLISSDGRGTYFNENDILPSNLKTYGAKGMKNLKDSIVVSMYAFSQNQRGKILLVTDHGHERVFDTQYLNLSERAGAQNTLMKIFKSDPHSIVLTQLVDTKLEKNDVYLMLSNGEILLHEVSDYHQTPLERYARTNMEDVKNADIIGCYNLSIITAPKNMVTYKIEKPQEEGEIEEENNDKKEQGFEQISIFDLNGD